MPFEFIQVPASGQGSGKDALNRSTVFCVGEESRRFARNSWRTEKTRSGRFVLSMWMALECRRHGQRSLAWAPKLIIEKSFLILILRCLCGSGTFEKRLQRKMRSLRTQFLTMSNLRDGDGKSGFSSEPADYCRGRGSSGFKIRGGIPQ